MKVILKNLYLFSILFTLSLISPVILGNNEANANCLGGTSTDANPVACNSLGNSSACEARAGCFWTTTVSGDTNDNAFTTTLCNVLRIVTGNGGKAFAAFAIVSLGIGFFTGKVSWGLMIGVAAGIAAMFGAPTIVAAISGGSTFDCTDRI